MRLQCGGGDEATESVFPPHERPECSSGKEKRSGAVNQTLSWKQRREGEKRQYRAGQTHRMPIEQGVEMI